MVCFRPNYLLLAGAVLVGGSVAQTPAPAAGQSEPQAQSSPGSQPSADQKNKDAKSDESNGNVLILKAPVMPGVPQVKAELRAVDIESRPKLNEHTRMQLISLMQAEFAHTRKYFPLGDKSLIITPEGLVTPNDASLFQQIQAKGAAAKVGDKVQVTNIFFHEKSITLQLNGGPKRKSKWYNHISIGMGGSGGSVAPLDSNQAEPTGAEFTLQFNKQIPEMNAEELRKLLSPVLDFGLKSAGQVYAETLPPKVRDAIKNHEVLVGMNRDMVVLAKDKPQQKVRDKDESGKDYEEWIYGAPPKDVVFVRFNGDEVVMVKTARIGQETLVKTEKEVDVKDGVASMASLAASNSPQDAKKQDTAEPEHQTTRPTLRRPGEEPDPSVEQQQRVPNGPVATHPTEPEWGTDGKKPADTSTPPPGNNAPPPDTSKPPL
jgi:hypothetical protein